MKREQIIRAWKDEDYRSSLVEAELSALPAHPAGLIELSELDILGAAAGDDGNPTPSIVVVTIVGSIIVVVPLGSLVLSLTIANKCF